MRRHLGDGFPLMVDANMKWTVDEAIRAARAFQPYDLTWLEEPIIPDDVAGHARVVREGGLPDRRRRKPAHACGSSSTYIAGGGVTYPGAGRDQLRRRHAPS